MELTDFLNVERHYRYRDPRYPEILRRISGRLWQVLGLSRPKVTPSAGRTARTCFEDPDEMAAFEAKYGYPLAVPETFMQMRDIAKFFTRPDDNLYGVGVYTQNDYDGMIMGYENTMFSWGVDWQDANNEVLGVVNSDQAVEALEFYKELYSFAPPGTNNAFFTEMNAVFINGQAAMVMNYFAFLPALLNPDVNPYADATGFFANPAGPYGDRYAALGGQGMSVINYISDERKQASLDFIKWFATAKSRSSGPMWVATPATSTCCIGRFPEQHAVQSRRLPKR